MAFGAQIVAAKLAPSKKSRVSSVTAKMATGSNTCPASERSAGSRLDGVSAAPSPATGTRNRSGPVDDRPCTAAAKMLESPVLSGMYRSAAAVTLASKPNMNKWANQAIPGADNLTKAAPSDSVYRRGGAFHAGKTGLATAIRL